MWRSLFLRVLRYNITHCPLSRQPPFFMTFNIFCYQRLYYVMSFEARLVIQYNVVIGLFAFDVAANTGDDKHDQAK